MKSTRIHTHRKLLRAGRQCHEVLHDIANPLSGLLMHLEQSIRCTQTLRRCHCKKALCIAQLLADIVRKHRSCMSSNQKQLFCPINQTRRALAGLDQKIRATKATVRLDYKHIRVKLPGNPICWCQIMSNLIDNAIDAYKTVPTQPRVEIIYTFYKKKLIVRVIDRGSGIPKHIQKKIFTLFYTTKPTGSGVGLAIVREIVEKEFNGSITVKSGEKQGSEFRIEVPVNL